MFKLQNVQKDISFIFLSYLGLAPVAHTHLDSILPSAVQLIPVELGEGVRHTYVRAAGFYN